MHKKFKIHYLKRNDGSEYKGGLKHDLPHYFGILKDPSQNKFSCEWKEGQIDGMAYILYKDGRQFLGYFQKGKKYGLGSISYGGKVYLGEYQQSKRTGYGEVIEVEDEAAKPSQPSKTTSRSFFEDKDVGLDSIKEDSSKINSDDEYQLERGKGRNQNLMRFDFTDPGKVVHSKRGYFLNGRLKGYGEFSIPSRQYCYKGMFKDGNFEGAGVEVTAEDSYCGNFEDGSREGIGQSQRRGEVYKGHWSKGMKERFGMLSNRRGYSYEGFFKRGKKHGVGRLKKAKRVIYLGGHFRNMMSGFGRYERNGVIYIGDQDKDLKHGFGYFKNIGKFTYIGGWKEGKKDGFGYEVTEFDEYKGEFLYGKRHGKGILKRRGDSPRAYLLEKGEIVSEIDENVAYILEMFTKSKIDSFFRESQIKLEKMDIDLKENIANLRSELSMMRQSFEYESETLYQKISLHREEFKGVIAGYKQLYKNFKKCRKSTKKVDFCGSRPGSEEEDRFSRKEKSPMSYFKVSNSVSFADSRQGSPLIKNGENGICGASSGYWEAMKFTPSRVVASQKRHMDDTLRGDFCRTPIALKRRNQSILEASRSPNKRNLSRESLSRKGSRGVNIFHESTWERANTPVVSHPRFSRTLSRGGEGQNGLKRFVKGRGPGNGSRASLQPGNRSHGTQGSPGDLLLLDSCFGPPSLNHYDTFYDNSQSGYQEEVGDRKVGLEGVEEAREPSGDPIYEDSAPQDEKLARNGQTGYDQNMDILGVDEDMETPSKPSRAHYINLEPSNLGPKPKKAKNGPKNNNFKNDSKNAKNAINNPSVPYRESLTQKDMNTLSTNSKNHKNRQKQQIRQKTQQSLNQGERRTERKEMSSLSSYNYPESSRRDRKPSLTYQSSSRERYNSQVKKRSLNQNGVDRTQRCIQKQHSSNKDSSRRKSTFRREFSSSEKRGADKAHPEDVEEAVEGGQDAHRNQARASQEVSRPKNGYNAQYGSPGSNHYSRRLFSGTGDCAGLMTGTQVSITIKEGGSSVDGTFSQFTDIHEIDGDRSSKQLFTMHSDALASQECPVEPAAGVKFEDIYQNQLESENGVGRVSGHPLRELRAAELREGSSYYPGHGRGSLYSKKRSQEVIDYQRFTSNESAQNDPNSPKNTISGYDENHRTNEIPRDPENDQRNQKEGKRASLHQSISNLSVEFKNDLKDQEEHNGAHSQSQFTKNSQKSSKNLNFRKTQNRQNQEENDHTGQQEHPEHVNHGPPPLPTQPHPSYNSRFSECKENTQSNSDAHLPPYHTNGHNNTFNKSCSFKSGSQAQEAAQMGSQAPTALNNKIDSFVNLHNRLSIRSFENQQNTSEERLNHLRNEEIDSKHQKIGENSHGQESANIQNYDSQSDLMVQDSRLGSHRGDCTVNFITEDAGEDLKPDFEISRDLETSFPQQEHKPSSMYGEDQRLFAGRLEEPGRGGCRQKVEKIQKLTFSKSSQIQTPGAHAGKTRHRNVTWSNTFVMSYSSQTNISPFGSKRKILDSTVYCKNKSSQSVSRQHERTKEAEEELTTLRSQRSGLKIGLEAETQFRLNSADYPYVLLVEGFLVLGGDNGLVTYPKDSQGMSYEEDLAIYFNKCEVGGLVHWKERDLIIAIDKASKQLYLFTYDLNLVKNVQFVKNSKNTSPAISRSSSGTNAQKSPSTHPNTHPGHSESQNTTQKSQIKLKIVKNVIFLNLEYNVFMVDLITNKVKIFKSFFEIADGCHSLPVFLGVEPDSQKMVGYSYSVKTDNIYAHYVDEESSHANVVKLTDLSDRFSLVKSVNCARVVDTRFMVLGGSSYDTDGSERPFVMLTLLDGSLLPISGCILDDVQNNEIYFLEVIEVGTGGFEGADACSEDGCGLFVLAAAKKWLFLFKIYNNSLVEFDRVCSDVDLTPSSFSLHRGTLVVKYADSNLIASFKLVKNSKKLITPKTAKNAKNDVSGGTSPHSVATHLDDHQRMHPTMDNFFSVSEMFTTSVRLLTERALGLVSKLKPIKLTKMDIDCYKKKIVFNVNKNKNFENYEKLSQKIDGFYYKVMKNYFSGSSVSELDDLRFIERFSGVGEVRVSGAGIDLGDLKIGFGGDRDAGKEVIYASSQKDFGLVYCLRRDLGLEIFKVGDSQIMSIEGFGGDNGSAEAEDVEIEGCKVPMGVISTANASKIFGVFNIIEGNSNPLATLSRANTALSTQPNSKNLQKTPQSPNPQKVVSAELVVHTAPNTTSRHRFGHLLDSVNGCEINFSQDTVFAIGKKASIAVLVAFEFTSDLLFISDYMRLGDEFRYLKRLPGSNHLILQTNLNITFVDYFEQTLTPVREIGFSGDPIDSCYLDLFNIYVRLDSDDDLFKLAPSTTKTATELIKITEKEVMALESKPKSPTDKEFAGISLESHMLKISKQGESGQIEGSEAIEEPIVVHKRPNNLLDDSKILIDGLSDSRTLQIPQTLQESIDEDRMTPSAERDLKNRVMKHLAYSKSSQDGLTYEIYDRGITMDSHEIEVNTNDIDTNKLLKTYDPTNWNTLGKVSMKEDGCEEMILKTEPEMKLKNPSVSSFDFVISGTFGQPDPQGQISIEYVNDLQQKTYSYTSRCSKSPGFGLNGRNLANLTAWLKNHRVDVYRSYKSLKCIKIELSGNGRFIYMLSEKLKLLVVDIEAQFDDYKDFALYPEQISTLDIYNFTCEGEDTCLGFCVKDSEIRIFKGQKLMNVFDSDSLYQSVSERSGTLSHTNKSSVVVPDGLGGPGAGYWFEPGTSCSGVQRLFYNPAMDKTKFVSRTTAIGIKSRDPHDRKQARKQIPVNSAINHISTNQSKRKRILWIQSSEGVRYTNFNINDQAVNPGQLLKIWNLSENLKKSRKVLNQPFKVRFILEIQEISKILSVMYFETSQLQILQSFDILTNEAKSLNLNTSKQLKNKIILNLESIYSSEDGVVLIAVGYSLASQEHAQQGFLTTIRYKDGLKDSFNFINGIKTDQPRSGILLEIMEVLEYEEYKSIGNVKKYLQNCFFACAEWDVLLYLWDGVRLQQLMVFSDLAQGMVYDVFLLGNELFVVGDNEESDLFRKVSFGVEMEEKGGRGTGGGTGKGKRKVCGIRA